MQYSEELKKKLLDNDKALSGIGCNIEEVKERLNCNDPFVGRIIDTARRYAKQQGLNTHTLDELYNEWEKAFFDPKNNDWAESFPYQETQARHK